MSGNEKNSIREATYGDTEIERPQSDVLAYTNIEISEKHRGGMRLFRIVIAMTVLLLTSLMWYGCEGPQGPVGEGVGDLDAEPPTVSFLDPSRSDTTLSSIFDVSVTASDNRDVAYVEFFFDGSSEMGDTTAIDSIPPYSWTWNIDSTGHSFGIFPIMVRAFDTSDNTADTPTLLKHYLPVPEEWTLVDYDGDEEGSLTMPDQYGDRYWNVRFTPDEPCELLEAHFEFRTPSVSRFSLTGELLNGGTDILIFAWNTRENGSGLPQTPALDSTYIAEGDLLYGDQGEWNIFDVEDWGLSFSEDFHIGFSVPHDLYDDYAANFRATPIIVSFDDSLPNPADHRSSEMEVDPVQWNTIQNNWNGNKYDFHIRALVRYSGGTTALISNKGELWRSDVGAR
ncbi:MAG TPA: hypothetical protein ENH10_01325 [Bacteroidetes bacterium]|nr:hypothetical protein BMS3Bbin04_01786 [bacterium BMS3Bbin04]HDO64661.1 hypothetical protein [Bacteroidota bacterium]HEX03786.1 hypothetical protein [Bacteroidota bacterium]